MNNQFEFETFKRLAKAYASSDPAHDYLHVERVFTNGQFILQQEPEADAEVVLTAILLHEVFNFPKNHPMSSESGEICALIAGQLLTDHHFNPDKLPKVQACIRNHSYSKGVVPTTLEEKIVQDADRLDAIGAIGLARCFATSAEMKRPFYDSQDPFAQKRELDDQNYAIDHFYKKLLRLGEAMYTKAGQELAKKRIDFMKHFLLQLSDELDVSSAKHSKI